MFFIPTLGDPNLFNDTLQISNSNENNSWTKQWNVLGMDFATSVAIDSFDDIYVLGSTDSNGNSATPFLSKFSKSGDLLWQKFLISADGNSTKTVYNIVKVDAADNLFIAGLIVNYTDAKQTLIISKYNSTGDLLWNKTIGKSIADGINDMDVDLFGNVYIVGINRFLKFNNTGTLMWNYTVEGVSTVSSIFENKIYVAGATYIEKAFLRQYNSSGFNLWNYNWTRASVVKDLTVDPEGSIFIADGNLILKVNSTGIPLWNCTLPGYNYLNDAVVFTNSTDEIYIATNRAIHCIDNSFFWQGGSCTRVYLSKINSSGVLLWDKICTGCCNSRCSDAAIDSQGNIYITGTLIYNFGSDEYLWDAILIKNPKEFVGLCIEIYYDLIFLILTTIAIIGIIFIIFFIRKRRGFKS